MGPPHPSGAHRKPDTSWQTCPNPQAKSMFQTMKRIFQAVKRTFQTLKRTFQTLKRRLRAGFPPLASTRAAICNGMRALWQAGCNSLAMPLQRRCNPFATSPAGGNPSRLHRIARRKQTAAFPDIFPCTGVFAWQSVVLYQSDQSPISLFLPIPKIIERELQPGGEAYGAFLSCPQKPTGFPLTPLL